MTKGVLLSGALGVLLGGLIVLGLFMWQHSPALDRVATASNFMNPAGGDPSLRSTGESPMGVRAQNLEHGQEPVAIVEPDQAGQVRVDTVFLPYPNDGKISFERKYAALDKGALWKMVLLLQKHLNEEVDQLVEDRYSMGVFDEKIYPSADAANTDSQPRELPKGLGDVWPCEKATLQSDGSLKRWTTVLTEAEYPELFAHRAEYSWVVHENWKRNR